MIFERHKSGKIFDGVEICPDSHLCKDSFAGPPSDIWQSRLDKSRVQHESKVRLSHLERSSVGEEGVKSEIVSSYLQNSNFYGGTALNCKIFNSEVRGNPLLRGRGKGILIVDSEISDDVHIDGEAVILGIKLNKMMRISGDGIWRKPPRYHELKNEITEIGITESFDNHCFIGCKLKDTRRWLKGKYRFGNAIGWPKEMVDNIAQKLEEWLDTPVEV